VCRARGKRVQIHHADDNPSNHDLDNLAVLCFDCHHETQLKGGFDRKLDYHQILEYRRDWLERVALRRDLADKLASGAAASLPVGSPPSSEETSPDQNFLDPRDRPPALLKYLDELPRIRAEAYERCRPLWDSGVTANMMNGNYEVVDVMQQVLVNLAAWYPPQHFGNGDPAEYMSTMTASRFEWHRSQLEPGGAGTGGTIVGVMAGGDVISDLEDMVVEMVGSLTTDDDEFQFKSWLQSWETESEGATGQ